MILLKPTNNSVDTVVTEVEAKEPLTAKDVIIRILVSILMVVLGANFGIAAIQTGLIYIPLKILHVSTETAGIITFAVMTVGVSTCYIIMMKLKQYRLYATSFYIAFMLLNIFTIIMKLGGAV